MAITPPISETPAVSVNEQGEHELAPGHRLPGWTVDALLERGDVDEARAELERLVIEGAGSGCGREMNDDLMQVLMTRARRNR